ncbi:MAG: sensor histidine kinase [Frankiales bacterium]|nr:sensor histidine kinase [Frankiales bacterium]
MASLVYAVVSSLVGLGDVPHPAGVVVLLGLMVAWTVVVTLLLERPQRRTRALLVTDLGLAAAALLSGRYLQGAELIEVAEVPSLTVTWGAIPVVACAVRGGPLGGGLAAGVMVAATLLWRGDVTRAAVGSCVLLLLIGVVIGYVVSLSREAESAYAAVVQREAAQAERERLARTVHDGVLQTLALVSRRSTDPQLAALAAEQEGALRRLVSGPAAPVPHGDLDLRTLLRWRPDADAHLAAPAVPVPLPAHAARELAAAVACCLDNVQQHAGGRAWVLVEDEGDAVLVTVRDDGPGIPPGRLEEAEREGRMGVARSVRGRVEDLGGSVLVTSTPGQGTEVELRVPRPRG